jgi:hypothetical protein
MNICSHKRPRNIAGTSRLTSAIFGPKRAYLP